MINRLIRLCLDNKLVVILLAVAIAFWGLMVAPFNWQWSQLPRNPVPVDAIPDIGENQQIVFTQWNGRSPQDIEDQITYPLTTALLGLPKVKTIRSYSMFGFSSIYIIFDEDAEFYWTRSRILEKLNSLAPGALPEGVAPQLGPDATGLGQVFWYTLEGYSVVADDTTPSKPTGGWDLEELRSTQDWHVRYALQGVEGVAEVASIGGFTKEYQVDVDPDKLRSFNIDLHEVFNAVRASNQDVGARTIEINSAEYVIRGLGLIESLDDLRKTVITQRNNVPITLDQVATVTFGPGLRRGALDKAGAEAVGGVVIARYGENPLAVIERVKEKIDTIEPGLPRKTLDDGTISRVKIVPFYDRSGLIQETLGTLENAVRQQILVAIIVVVLMVFRLRSAAIVSATLPFAVLFAFIGMKLFKVDANIVALSGIAIAIGTIVDIGIVLTENILRHLDKAKQGDSRLDLIYRACSEVGPAVFTAVLTTIISFLPVFTMEAAEGKLFKPLAYTKTFALLGSIVVAIAIIPPLAHLFLRNRRPSNIPGKVASVSTNKLSFLKANRRAIVCGLIAFVVALFLGADWKPVGQEAGFGNALFVLLSIGGLIGLIHLFIRAYPSLLGIALRMKGLFLALCALVLVSGFSIWSKLGREFMPNLDEGSFLFMPTTMTHASIGEVMDVLRKQDMAINAIPEVELAVGKLGRVESALDPAPVSMIETIVTYKSEYLSDPDGDPIAFAFDKKSKEFLRDHSGELIPDPRGRPYRQWRDDIRSPEDIWNQIVRAAEIPGTTSAPKLQPIAARLVMLQSGVRAPMAYKVQGPDLETLERVTLELERILKQIPSIRAETVFADRVVGKPYLEIDIDREAIARYGIQIQRAQEAIEVAVGGKTVTHTIEGRERYPVRLRYKRELRDSIEEIENILVAAPDGTQIPLKELASINYLRGPQVIKSENTSLVSYVIFDKQSNASEVDVVEEANAYIEALMNNGAWTLPIGVSKPLAIGSYENQVRANQTLAIVLPAALLLILLILYLLFRKAAIALIVFAGVLFAWSGGFILIWLYGQSWFLDFDLFGVNARELFQIGPINLSVAVWVGFLALFGIATDDGVLMSTYLEQRFREAPPQSGNEIRQRVIEAASRRVRPAMMTSATTLLALLPVLTSTGRGSDVMVPMAIPTFGGMLLAIVTIFFVPVIYCSLEELKANRQKETPQT